jgi:hypothetical protein
MRRLLLPCLIAITTLSACHQDTAGDAVRRAYDNKADQIDAEAKQQPTSTAKEIYHDQADSYREEGKDREKGLEGGKPSKGLEGGPTAGGVNTTSSTPQ